MNKQSLLVRKRFISFVFFFALVLQGVAEGAFAEPGVNDSGSVQLPATSVKRLVREKPPVRKGIEWLRVPYDKAEDELIALFHKDIAKLEDLTSTIAIFNVRTPDEFPGHHSNRLRAKLEKILLTSRKLKVKQCASCEEARFDPLEIKQLAQVARELNVDMLISSEVVYMPEDLQLRVRVLNPNNGQIAWLKEYSVADLTRSREQLNDAMDDELSQRDSLSRVVLGEIAFSMALSPGVMWVPNIDTGSGRDLNGIPSVDLFIGERYDRGRRLFGFILGGAFNTSTPSTRARGTPLTMVGRVGPRFSYIFNPYNVSSAQFGLSTELGAMLGDSVTTGYLGFGPEIIMGKRFSLSLMPIFILPAKAKSPQIVVPAEAGGGVSGGDDIGKFGGFSLLMKFGMRW